LVWIFRISCGQEFYGAAPRDRDLLCFLQFWTLLDPYFWRHSALFWASSRITFGDF
jgi:hypothetical protein